MNNWNITMDGDTLELTRTETWGDDTRTVTRRVKAYNLGAVESVLLSEGLATVHIDPDIPANIRDHLQAVVTLAERKRVIEPAEPMDEDEFWALVERAQWKKDHDYERAKSILHRSLGSATNAARFSQRWVMVRGALAQAIGGFEEENGSLEIGGDSFSDLVADAIGRGRESAYEDLRNPVRLAKRSSDYDYEESFAYAIPYPADFAPMQALLEDRQRLRDRLAKQAGAEVREAVEDILVRYLRQHPGLAHSPIQFEVSRAASAALSTVLKEDDDEEEY